MIQGQILDQFISRFSHSTYTLSIRLRLRGRHKVVQAFNYWCMCIALFARNTGAGCHNADQFCDFGAVTRSPYLQWRIVSAVCGSFFFQHCAYIDQAWVQTVSLCMGGNIQSLVDARHRQVVPHHSSINDAYIHWSSLQDKDDFFSNPNSQSVNA